MQQCPLLASRPRAGQWLADREDGQDPGVVVSDVVDNSLSADFDYDVLDLDYSSSVAILKDKVCSVRGNLA